MPSRSSRVDVVNACTQVHTEALDPMPELVYHQGYVKSRCQGRGESFN
jgi:hypothetical protein